MGQQVQIAWPCEHDGMQGIVVGVGVDVIYCALDKPRNLHHKRGEVVRYPADAYKPKKEET